MITLSANQKRIFNNSAWLFLRYLLVTALAMLFIIPFLWMLSTSFTESGQAYSFPPKLVPQPFTFANYSSLWGGLIPFDRFYLNTTLVVVFVEIGTLLSCTVVAFSFARLQWRGRNFWFVILLATMMLPVLIMFLLFQRYFVKGIVLTGMKG